MPEVWRVACGMRLCIYILAHRRNSTLYVGATSDLTRRISEHRADLVEGFTKRYAVHTLVYVEFHTKMSEAISREKRVKTWRRKWKIELAEQANPKWRDLFEELA